MKWPALIPIAAIAAWLVQMRRAKLILARTLYGEARGEGAAGMAAVAAVILNRVKAESWFGSSVIEVALKPKQFSAWNDGDPNRAVIEALVPGTGNATFDQAYEIAGQAIAGTLADPTGGATHYHNASVNPAWADPAKVAAVIGNHVFYSGVA